MKDEDFQRRLDSILAKLYQMDYEVKEYLKGQKTDPRVPGCDPKPYLKKRDIFLDGKYDPK